jgi:RHS repeat-associated protein
VGDIVSNSVTVLDHIDYGAFGKIIDETGPSNGDRFKYSGMQDDQTTGLYYDYERWYDPAAGRFVSQDPVGFAAGDDNLYRYVTNNSENQLDPSGLADWGDLMFPADVYIWSGINTNGWFYQTGVGNAQLSVSPGLNSQVDGLYTPAGYLKIPNGTHVDLMPSPAGFVIYTDGPVEWTPVAFQNPQGDNPAAGEKNGANWKKPTCPPTIYRKRPAPKPRPKPPAKPSKPTLSLPLTPY